MTMIISGSGGATFPDSTTQTTAASLATPLAVTGNSTSGAEIRLPEDTDNGSNYVALKAADSIATNLTLTLPAADGTSGQALVTDGAGTLSFGTAGAPGVDVQTFTSSGTWTKPSSYAAASRVLIQAWGAGGSGGRNSPNTASGGGGGGYCYGWFTLSQLGSTETVTIGAGGAAKTSDGTGNDGGNTTVGSLITAYGGGAGGDGSGPGGGGGGFTSKGNSEGGGQAGKPLGMFRDATLTTAYVEASGGRGEVAGTTVQASGGDSFYKGGGGAGTVYNCDSYPGNAGSSIWGGGGGGCASRNGASSGGTSKFGGNGGAGNVATSGNATAGTQPGGGGGGKARQGGTGNSGAGADGKVIITVFAGV